MDAVNRVLLVDAQGQPTGRHLLVESNDWDRIADHAHKVYMPYVVQPHGRSSIPDSTLHAAHVGRFVLSRFTFGTGLTVSDMSPEAGNGMVLTTLRGGAEHRVPQRAPLQTVVGDTLAVDNSRTAYEVSFSPDHLQLNLIFKHDMLEDMHERWYGQQAAPHLWHSMVKFGGAGSSWMALLEYACRCVIDMPDETENGPLGKHLEELLGMHLLMQWRQNIGQESFQHVPRLAPAQVRRAEDYIRQYAADVPTLTQIANVVGVSVRSLNRAFHEFRGYTPMDFLREERYRAVRTALMAAPPGSTVAAVASMWGFANLGLFAVNYKRKFGESPSQTLRRLRTA